LSLMDLAKQSSGVHFQGTGRSFPSSVSPMVQAVVASHCIAAATALGLTSGVLDMDVRYSESSGPRVLEVNARMGGGSVSVMHSLAYGLDLVEVHLRALLGCPVQHLAALMPTDPEVHYEAGWVMSPRDGVTVGMAAFVERLHADFLPNPSIVEITPMVCDGKTVMGYESRGVPDCLIQVITRSSDKQSAEQLLRMVMNSAEASIGEFVLSGEALLGFMAREIAPALVSSPAATAVAAAVGGVGAVGAPSPGIVMPPITTMGH